MQILRRTNILKIGRTRGGDRHGIYSWDELADVGDKFVREHALSHSGASVFPDGETSFASLSTLLSSIVFAFFGGMAEVESPIFSLHVKSGRLWPFKRIESDSCNIGLG